MFELIPVVSFVVVACLALIVGVIVGATHKAIEWALKSDKVSRRTYRILKVIATIIQFVVIIWIGFVVVLNINYQPIYVPKLFILIGIGLLVIFTFCCLMVTINDLRKYVNEPDIDCEESSRSCFVSSLVMTIMMMVLDAFCVMITFGSMNPYL